MLLVLIVVLVLVLELINDSLHEHLILLKLLHHRSHVVRPPKVDRGHHDHDQQV